MNSKDLLATLVKALAEAEAQEKPKRRTYKLSTDRAPSKRRPAGKAKGNIGLTTLVPKPVYNCVVEHCCVNDITISSFIRGLVDAYFDRVQVSAVKPKPKPKPKTRRKTGGNKRAHSDRELSERLEAFYKENPSIKPPEMFERLRREHGMKFQSIRANKLLKKIKARTLNGKSENIG